MAVSVSMGLFIDIHIIDIGAELILLILCGRVLLFWHVFEEFRRRLLVWSLHVALHDLAILLGGLAILNGDDVGLLRKSLNGRVNLLLGVTVVIPDYSVLNLPGRFRIERLFWVQIFDICLLKRLFGLLSELEAGRLLCKLVDGVGVGACHDFPVVIDLRMRQNFWLHTRHALLVFEGINGL